jgi:CRP-like cAMP-binding protein
MDATSWAKHSEQLADSPFGRKVGSEVCTALLAMAETVGSEAGETLFEEGDPPEGVYFVCEGQVKLIRSGPGYREHIVHLAERQAMFGEASLFLACHPVTAVALKPGLLLRFPRAPFLEYMARQPVLQGYVLAVMAHWLEQLIEKIDELTLCDGAQRLARYLVGLHEKNPYAGYVTAAQVDLPTRKRDLATMLNMNQPSLSRILRQLQDQTLIEVKGRRVFLKDLEALRGLARLPEFRGVQRDFA